MVSFCPQCGKRVEAAFNFCPFCGGKLPLPEEEPMQITPTSSLKVLLMCWATNLKKRSLCLSCKAKPSSRSPKKDKSAFLRPLPEGEILVDQNSRQQWVLGKLMIQSDRGVLYKGTRCISAESAFLYLFSSQDVKDGRLFHEQNFFQRAAKKASVEKWKKQHSLDILEYLHENEYTLGDITAGSIYVNPANLAMVTLADYCFAYRYSPGGEHVSYREGSRTPHEGSLEFISVDSHKGVAPSRRSDLESLGYCLVKWLCDFLPWSADLTDPCVVMEQKERFPWFTFSSLV
uniref:Inactive serine/threonine-protein kinase VRK3 n=1 Tax=Salvator merianae TaxID=96440 RepID=A0A8D0DT13_SALMN